MALTYSFAVIVVECGVFVIWPRQCGEVLVMYGEVLCLISRWLCYHANFNSFKHQGGKKSQQNNNMSNYS